MEGMLKTHSNEFARGARGAEGRMSAATGKAYRSWSAREETEPGEGRTGKGKQQIDGVSR